MDPSAVWQRYRGRAATLGWFDHLLAALKEAGFDEPAVVELEAIVAELAKTPAG